MRKSHLGILRLEFMVHHKVPTVTGILSKLDLIFHLTEQSADRRKCCHTNTHFRGQ